jgi:Glycosyl-hydrolase 97 N-terminal
MTQVDHRKSKDVYAEDVNIFAVKVNQQVSKLSDQFQISFSHEMRSRTVLVYLLGTTGLGFISASCQNREVIHSFMRTILFLLCTLNLAFASDLTTLGNITSPNKQLTFTVLQSESGELKYTVRQQDTPLLAPSVLGIERTDQSFTTGMVLESTVGPIRIDELFRLVHGKKSLIRTYANETRFEFQNENGAKLHLIVRVYDDGVAFRYVFPEEDDSLYTVPKELSSFNFASEGQFWGQP